MSPSVEFHRASADERLQAYRNVHEFWGRGLSLEEHVERRLASVQHNRAVWYVGCDDGRVVTSLGCYPLQFRLGGSVVGGMAIGAVHTLPECRGRGLAPQLFEFVEQDQREQGTGLSMLFSDIRPAYYERLGYQVCPSWEAAIATSNAFPIASQVVGESPGYRFELTSPAACRRDVLGLYERYHGPKPISVVHDEPYLDYLNAKAADDEYFLLRDESGNVIAYVRVLVDAERLLIREFAMDADDETTWRVLLAQVVMLAAERDVSHVAGWLPRQSPLPDFAAVVEASGRSRCSRRWMIRSRSMSGSALRRITLWRLIMFEAFV